MINTRYLLTGIAVACLANSASAGSATLDDLLGGGSLESDSTFVIFDNFGYIPSGLGGAPQPEDINVVTSENGLSFFSVVAANPGDVIDFIISYDVTAQHDCLLTSASQSSLASASGEGFVGLAEVVTDGASGNVMNLFTDDFTQNEDTATFDPTSSLSVSTDIGLAGPAFLSDFSQDFGVECHDGGTGIPTPSAAVAGLALIGLTLRRRRAV